MLINTPTREGVKNLINQFSNWPPNKELNHQIKTLESLVLNWDTHEKPVIQKTLSSSIDSLIKIQGFALGCAFFQMYTNKLPYPFKTETDGSINPNFQKPIIRNLSSFLTINGAPPHISEMIVSMIHPDPNQRMAHPEFLKL